MDVESEVKLYDHVEFLTESTNPPLQSTKPKKSKTKKPSQLASPRTTPYKSPNVKFGLTANELLFIPKSYDPSPLRHPTTNHPNDWVRKRKYMEKFKDIGSNEQRKLRAKQDARYLPHKTNELSLLKSSDSRMLCLDHLNGRCGAVNCDKYHQIRHPRMFGVCKYYMIGSCHAGATCPYMHEEFPCRYYYLNLPHPKCTETNECRFKHGGPLPPRMRKYFKQQLEEWARKVTAKDADQFQNTFMSYTDKFDERQKQLQHEYGVKVRDVEMSSSNETFSLEKILSVNQIKTLAKRNATNAAEVNRIPVDELIDCGLSMDQIYQITINACNESNQNDAGKNDTTTGSYSFSNEEIIVNDSMSSTETESSFVGFRDIDLNDAVEELECKKVIADQTTSVNIATDSSIYACNPTKFEKCMNTQADISDDSSDSDDDVNLTIDEDV